MFVVAVGAMAVPVPVAARTPNRRRVRACAYGSVGKHKGRAGKQGQGGRWTRIYRSARRALFTPFKEADGPNKRRSLKMLRVTRGKSFTIGREFKIIDEWTVPSHAHRMLEGAWMGTTDF